MIELRQEICNQLLKLSKMTTNEEKQIEIGNLLLALKRLTL